MDLVIYFKGTSTVCLSILVGITLFIEVFLCWDLTFSFFISLEIVLNWKLSSFIFQDISRLFYFEGNDVIITALNYRLDIICFIERCGFKFKLFITLIKKYIHHICCFSSSAILVLPSISVIRLELFLLYWNIGVKIGRTFLFLWTFLRSNLL